MRLNPRQRWHEGDGHGLGWDRDGSTCAGVPAVIWGAIIALSHEYQTNLPEWQPTFGSSTKAEYDQYRQSVLHFGNELFTALKEVPAVAGHRFVKRPMMNVLCGRGRGPDREITVVSANYAAMRSFLTSAALGWYEKYPAGTKPDKWMALVKLVIEMLDKSSDRRPFNQYTYRDIAISDLDSLGRIRRLERARDAVKFRRWFEGEFPGPRVSNVGIPDWKVAEQMKGRE